MNNRITSQYTIEQQNEEESRNFIRYHITKLKWKFRDLNQDNDIDGEIEVFKPNSNEQNSYTSAKFIKVQLKSTNILTIEGSEIIYDCSIKFLNFCDICDIPIVLVLYDVKDKTAYWIWMQDYIYKKLDDINPSWRKNKATVRIRIPLENRISENVRFSEDFEEIALHGLNQIQQMRKSNTYKNYYFEIQQDDISNFTERRIVLKLVVEKSFSESKEAMKLLINKVNKNYICSDYYRNEKLKQRFDGHEANVVLMYFYNDIRSVNNGLPFCRTQWVNPSSKTKISNFNFDEELNGIKIKWESDNNILDQDLCVRRYSKGEYLDTLYKHYKLYDNITTEIRMLYQKYNSNEISFDELKKQISIHYKPANKLFFSFSDLDKYAPVECHEVDELFVELTCILNNIFVVVRDNTRKEENIKYLVNMYINDIKQTEEYFKYELRKIK